MSGEGGPWSCLTASIRTHRCHLHYDNISPRSYQLGNIALHGCQVGWKEGTRSPKDSNLCGCDTRLSVVCPPQMVKNQYEVFVRNKQTNKQILRFDFNVSIIRDREVVLTTHFSLQWNAVKRLKSFCLRYSVFLWHRSPRNTFLHTLLTATMSC